MGRVMRCTESFCSQTENCYNEEQPCGRVVGHTGPCRCGYHQGLRDEAALRRKVEAGKIPPTKFTPIEELPHTDPLLQKVAEVRKVGGFTPATGPGTVAPAAFTTGSLDEPREWPRSYSQTAIDNQLYPELKDRVLKNPLRAVRDLFTSTPEQLGNAARLAASGVTGSERILVEELAQEEMRKGNYATEMLLRGLLVRSERVKQAEDDAARRYQQAMNAQTNADLLQRKLDQAATITQAQAKKLEAAEAARNDVQRVLDYTKKNLEETDRLRKKHFLDTQTLKAKLDVRSDSTTWTTASGDVLFPRQFSADHLMNTIRYIERLPEKEPREIICDYDGDGGPVFEPGEPAGPDRYNVYPLLLKEARKRGFLLSHDKIEITSTTGFSFKEKKD